MIELQSQNEPASIKLYSPLTLAYLGDAVFELMVRYELTDKGNIPSGKLHTIAKSYVSASSQSAWAEIVLPYLSQEELEIFKRGRNSHPRTRAKNMSTSDYMRATGLEALFGYLYLKGEFSRIRDLFSMICKEHDRLQTEE